MSLALVALPTITDPVLLDEVSALTRAGDMFRRLFFLRATDEEIRAAFAEYGESIETAEAIIISWRAHLGHQEGLEEF